MRLELIFTIALALTVMVFGHNASAMPFPALTLPKAKAEARIPAADTRMPASAETCKFKTADIGTIIGRGSNYEGAFEDAVSKCVERRQAMFQERSATNIRSLSSDGNDEFVERSEMYIDICVNLSCS